MAGEIDPVEEASEESFPASDAPAWAMGEEGKGLMVSNNSAQHRFEVSIEGKIAFLDYHLTPPAITLIHTESARRDARARRGGQVGAGGARVRPQRRAARQSVVSVCGGLHSSASGIRGSSSRKRSCVI
jgi:hypothetical protein